MYLPVYAREPASAADFINFWASQETAEGRDKDDKLYKPYIGKPLTAEGLRALYRWKNQGPLSAGKSLSVEINYIAYLETLRRLPLTTEPSAFLDKFKNGGATWRIFLLHCWSQSKYPIYDQHVHRAMKFIQGRPRAEEEIDRNDSKKIHAYLNEDIPFFESFGVHGPRMVDRALWALGRFVKNTRFPDIVGQPKPSP